MKTAMPRWAGAGPAFALAAAAVVAAFLDFLLYSPCIGCAVYFAVTTVVWLSLLAVFTIVVARADYSGRPPGALGGLAYLARSVVRTLGAFYLYARGRLGEMRDVPILIVRTLIVQAGIIIAMAVALTFDQAAIGNSACILLPIVTLIAGGGGHAFIGWIFLQTAPLPDADFSHSALSGGDTFVIDTDMQNALNDPEGGPH